MTSIKCSRTGSGSLARISPSSSLAGFDGVFDESLAFRFGALAMLLAMRRTSTLSRALKFGHSLQDVFGSAGENELVIDQLELSNRDGNIVLRQAEKAASIDDGI
jgi:hypothetical protein